MRLNFALVMLTLAALALAACQNNGFKKSESGLEHKFFTENPKNQMPTPGDIVAIKFKYTNQNDQLIEESAVFRTQLKKPLPEAATVDEAIGLMHKGDSALFLIKAEDYYVFTLKQPLPKKFSPDEFLKFYIKLIDITTFDEFEKERQAQLISNEREEDKLLLGFLKRTNIQVEPTISGLYYVETKKGNGAAPTPGKKASIHYMGYFIDGQMFDNSYERNEPFSFTLGTGEVIQGMDEGVAKMKVGGKAKLVIHSSLAYGAEGAGPVAPHTTLVFEIELLDVQH